MELNGQTIIKSRTCLLNYPSEIHFDLVRWHSFFEKGSLAVPGGIGDQPIVYLEAMELVGAVLNGQEN